MASDNRFDRTYCAILIAILAIAVVWKLVLPRLSVEGPRYVEPGTESQLTDPESVAQERRKVPEPTDADRDQGPAEGTGPKPGERPDDRSTEEGTATTDPAAEDPAPGKPLAIVFDAEKVAMAEARMWRAYYAENPVAIGMELLQLMTTQFNLPRRKALAVTQPLMRAAQTFEKVRSGYHSAVLPDLVEAYTELKRVSGMDFVPEDTARAELTWWVARRMPGSDSPEHVGQLIAELYARLFGKECQEFEAAGLLRARAAAERDRGGRSCNWGRVESLLIESYGELRKGLVAGGGAP